MPTAGPSWKTAPHQGCSSGSAFGSGQPNRAPTFLNIDDDSGFAQFLGEALILPAEFLHLLCCGLRLDLGRRLCGSKRSNAGLSLPTPPTPALSIAQVSRLKLKWAFAYAGGRANGQPTIVGDRVYVSSESGHIYALNAKSGCEYWTFDAGAPMRSAISIGGSSAYFGDESANVFAVDIATGKQLWKSKVEQHPIARISRVSGRSFSEQAHIRMLYVPRQSGRAGSSYRQGTVADVRDSRCAEAYTQELGGRRPRSMCSES